MKAVRVNAFNMAAPAEAATVTEVPVPEPKDGEALVRMTMRPVDPADLFSLMGVYPGFTTALPATVGLEGAGVIEKPAAGGKFAKGQRVTVSGFPAEHGNGTWTEYICLKEADLTAVPDSVTDVQASQFLVNPLTAYGMLKTSGTPKGEYLLFNAAGSALCRQLTGLCKHEGVKSIGLVRRKEQCKELVDAGLTHCFCLEDADVVAQIKAATGGKGAYAALDCIGGPGTEALGMAVRQGGTVYVYGAMGGLQATVPVPGLIFAGLTVTGFWLGPWMRSMSPEEQVRVKDEVMAHIASGVMPVGAGEVFPLDKVQEAIAHSTKVARGGKVLLSS
ncbi:unnamed protein product [Pedinophyceae sp. YPF-701]|nr:unnamed protein product [Pedinophyceae sp. YPF-701]